MVVLDDVPVDIPVQEVAQWAAAWTAATENTENVLEGEDDEKANEGNVRK